MKAPKDRSGSRGLSIISVGCSTVVESGLRSGSTVDVLTSLCEVCWSRWNIGELGGLKGEVMESAGL